MEFTDRIGEIECLLAQRGMSVAQLCRVAEVATTTWTRWKNGMVPRDKIRQRVEAAFSRLMETANGKEAA